MVFGIIICFIGLLTALTINFGFISFLGVGIVLFLIGLLPPTKNDREKK